METRAVNLKKEPHDIYIGRGSMWGNPFIMKNQSNEERVRVIEDFRIHLFQNEKLLYSLKELKGKTLGCYCKPLACHGDLLSLFAEMESIPLKKCEKSGIALKFDHSNFVIHEYSSDPDNDFKHKILFKTQKLTTAYAEFFKMKSSKPEQRIFNENQTVEGIYFDIPYWGKIIKRDPHTAKKNKNIEYKIKLFEPITVYGKNQSIITINSACKRETINLSDRLPQSNQPEKIELPDFLK